jgi:hypothetical protein
MAEQLAKVSTGQTMEIRAPHMLVRKEDGRKDRWVESELPKHERPRCEKTEWAPPTETRMGPENLHFHQFPGSADSASQNKRLKKAE